MSALALAIAALGLGSLAWGAVRSHRDLVRWLGRDPLGGVRLRSALLLAAALLGLGMLALPRAPELRSSERVAPPLVLLIDVSRSMAVADVAPSRLRRARRLAEQLIAEPDAPPTGLVLFARQAFAALPPTRDRDLLRAYLRELDADVQSARGTDLTRGLAVAAELFAAPQVGLARPAPGAGGAILLLSDGEHDARHPARELDASVSALQARGVRVIAVGLGRTTGGIVPIAGGGSVLDRAGRPVVSARQDAVLQRVAAQTGGRYLRELEDRPQPRDLLPLLGARVRAASGGREQTLLILAIFAALALEAWQSCAPAQGAARGAVRTRPARWRSRVPRAAVLLAALLGAGAVPWDELLQAERRIERGDARGALEQIEQLEQREGASPASRLRAAHAHYRIGDFERAAAACLDVLGADAASAAERRVASFNLGNAMLELGQLEQAREAYWSVLLDDPGDREVRFNYELVLGRLPPAQDPGGTGEPEQTQDQGSSVPQPSNTGAGQQGSDGASPEPGPEEAQRWLDTLEESLQRPLREQLQDAFEPQDESDPGRQTW